MKGNLEEFYADYGHMTPEGNRLIAEAIGDVILASPGGPELR